MALIVAFAITVATTPAFAWLARRLDIVDRPGPLKVQSRPVAYLGGVAVLAGLLGPALLARPVLAIPLVLATLLGLADDVADLGLGVRVTWEIGIGILVPVAVAVPGPLVPVVAVAVVALINAVNLLDGLDGLASGVAFVSAVGFALILDGDLRVLAVGLAGALAGFLIWNRPPARVYLGDAGSYLIGTALAVLAAATLGEDGSVHITAAAVLLVGVPVGDTSVAIVRRWRAKRPLFVGDRGHVYDQLVARQWTAPQAVVACILAQVVLATVAVAVAQLSDDVAVAVTVATTAAAAAWALRTFTSPSSWSS